LVLPRILHVEITELENQIKHGERFIIVTNFKELLAIDTKTKDKLDIKFKDLIKHYDFFLPWAGMEKAEYHAENPADVKAAEKMAKLFDEIKKDNPDETPKFIHGLNIFLSRLLFCFFAEDTAIFTNSQFTKAISSHTQADGSDLDKYLENLFKVMDTNDIDRKDLPKYLEDFPYVNGGLFKEIIEIPKFTKHSRQAIIDSGELDWSAINPDIFGSMFQGVILADKRGSLGMHYTSVPNIMKVINPLFLDELNEEFEDSKGDNKKLNKLLIRIRNIKIFDPACGSGNFLIVAYKELRKLEMRIFKEAKMLNMSNISLSNFYGIKIDDFAHEIAKLALWLSEHQMNVEFLKEFGRTNPTLPLKEAGEIVCGNATRLDWEEVCPKKEGDEIYILGNPPYIGGKSQSKEQKEDMKFVFIGIKKFKELDYIACWFLLASKYLKEKSKFSFVTTSSLNEGAQVEQIWPLIISNNNEIFFAYKPFNWTNNAKSKAGVTVSIVGVSKNYGNKIKYIYTNSLKQIVGKINGYLIPGNDICISKKNKSISKLPTMITGNSPYEGGNLMLNLEEKNDLIQRYPNSTELIRKTYGAKEFINNIDRWCLWIKNEQLEIAEKILPIKDRIENIIKLRKNGGEVARGLVKRPHQFRYTHTGETSILIVPIVSSSRRNYIPMGILPKETIILSSAAAIYDTEAYVFSIISSKLHMQWVKLTAGRLRGDIRYLSGLSYNTFPFPNITKKQKEELTECVFKILEEREKHSEKTLAQLYDPDKMPDGLREAHRLNDLAIEKCYREKPFESDEERLEYLFKMYEKMVEKE